MKKSSLNKNFGMLKHLSQFLPLKTLDQMYKFLVRSHLEYCDIIYPKPPHLNKSALGISVNSQMEKVENIQYQAALAVQNSMKNWDGKLYLIAVKCRRILQIHNIFNNKTPS